MNITFDHGYPDLVGKREIWNGNAVGPTSYDSTNKDPVYFPVYQGYVDNIFPCITVSGTYMVVFKPSVAGPRAAWVAEWFTLSGMTEVSGSTDLSAEKVKVGGYSGKY